MSARNRLTDFQSLFTERSARLSVHRLNMLFLGGAAFFAALGGVLIFGPGGGIFLTAPFLATVTAAGLAWLLSVKLMSEGRANRFRAGLVGFLCSGLSMVVAAILFLLIFSGFAVVEEGFFGAMFTGIVITQVFCGLFAYPMGVLAALAAWHLSRDRKLMILTEAEAAF